ncbi:MAG: hypothetical protein IPN96_18780 [Anaerolineales bacterium]|nr:hypothetical protein [Anaerolineales bacterium]
MLSLFGRAFAKSRIAAGTGLVENCVCLLISVNDYEKKCWFKFARDMSHGLSSYMPPGTADMCQKKKIAEVVEKAMDGSSPNCDLIRSGKVQLVLNTPLAHDIQMAQRSVRRPLR